MRHPGIFYREGAKDAKGGMIGEAGGVIINVFACRWLHE